MAGKKAVVEVKVPGYREDVLAAMTAMLTSIPGVKPGQPGFYVGGKMLACAFGEGVAIMPPHVPWFEESLASVATLPK